MYVMLLSIQSLEKYLLYGSKSRGIPRRSIVVDADFSSVYACSSYCVQENVYF
jgi:hypothetical protein